MGELRRRCTAKAALEGNLNSPLQKEIENFQKIRGFSYLIFHPYFQDEFIGLRAGWVLEGGIGSVVDT